jgi:hypothetical protein
MGVLQWVPRWVAIWRARVERLRLDFVRLDFVFCTPLLSVDNKFVWVCLFCMLLGLGVRLYLLLVLMVLIIGQPFAACRLV